MSTNKNTNKVAKGRRRCIRPPDGASIDWSRRRFDRGWMPTTTTYCS